MSDDTRRIRTDVPPDMHPDTLQPLRAALDVQGTPGREALTAAEAALGALYAGYATLNNAIEAVKARRKNPQPPQLVPPMHMPPDLQRSAQIAFDNSAPKIDAATTSLRKAQEKIKQRIKEATSDPDARTSVGVALAGQVREYVRTLKGGNRLGFLYDRIKADDRRTFDAVVSAPAYLSGLDEKDIATLRDVAATTWALQDFEQDKAVERAYKRVMRAAQLFVDKYSGVIRGEETADAVAQRALKKLEGVGRG